MTENFDGERDLDHLLRNMEPNLEDEELVFCSLPSHEADEYLDHSVWKYLHGHSIHMPLLSNLLHRLLAPS